MKISLRELKQIVREAYVDNTSRAQASTITCPLCGTAHGTGVVHQAPDVVKSDPDELKKYKAWARENPHSHCDWRHWQKTGEFKPKADYAEPAHGG